MASVVVLARGYRELDAIVRVPACLIVSLRGENRERSPSRVTSRPCGRQVEAAHRRASAARHRGTAVRGTAKAPGEPRAFCGGRYQTRTDDLFRVKEARYQLRQSPASRTGLNDRTGCRTVLPTNPKDTRGAHLVLHPRPDRVMSYECSGQAPERNADVAQLVAHNLAKVGVASSSLVIRSSGGNCRQRGWRTDHDTWVEPHHGGVAERLGTGLQSRLHGFESRRHLASQ